MHRFFIIVSGPTAVGKTSFIDDLIKQLPFDCALINGDMGQMYTPLSIGTAKPDYQAHSVPHYLFDLIDKPESFTVDHYRALVIEAMEMIWKQNKIPIIIGGSGFYLKSLFFAPYSPPIIAKMPIDIEQKTNEELYVLLISIDPLRANAIDPNDRYRIVRALEIWYTTGVKPSSVQPIYESLAPCFLLFLEREVVELDERIYERTRQMVFQGWIEEVISLSKIWKDFLLEKKIIGYPEIIKYIHSKDSDREKLIAAIGLKTRQYAKKQRIFFQLLKKQLLEASQNGQYLLEIATTNLTLSDHTLYLNDTVKKLTQFMEYL